MPAHGRASRVWYCKQSLLFEITKMLKLVSGKAGTKVQQVTHPTASKPLMRRICGRATRASVQQRGGALARSRGTVAQASDARF